MKNSSQTNWNGFKTKGENVKKNLLGLIGLVFLGGSISHGATMSRFSCSNGKGQALYIVYLFENDRNFKNGYYEEVKQIMRDSTVDVSSKSEIIREPNTPLKLKVDNVEIKCEWDSTDFNGGVG